MDDICLIRSMTTEAINHDPAHMFMNTGSQIAGRPSMGSWVTYGLGSVSENLPAFIVLISQGKGRSPQPIAARQWSSGFLPSRHQGVQLRSQGDPVLYLSSPAHVSRQQQTADIQAINALDRQHQALVNDPEIATRIAQYEMAFQMQSSVPELMDVRSEDARTLELYGCQPGDGSFAGNCLLARRLAERGVRFIQLYHRDWDHHSLLREELPLRAREVDQACAALIKDLKRLGMFDDTLIVWTGEFGRTPMSQRNKGPVGRDHHNKAMSIWLAGGGIRRGYVHGATDDLGYAAVEDVCNVHDLHATMLHQLGIDHESFSVKFQGLDARLTGVERARANSGDSCVNRTSSERKTMMPALFAPQTRRAFLENACTGLGTVALASLLRPATLAAAPTQGVLTSLPLPQRAKRVIWLTMAGGPSQLETFDYKPKLAEVHGQAMPESFTKGQQLAQLQGQKLICFGPQHPFAKFGKNQTEICSLFPQIGSVIDDICLVRSMTTEAINHDPAHMFMNTGSQIAGRPSMGAWVTYGLGCESENLPGFVVLTSLGAGGQNQPIAARQWSSGFLPSRHQGVQLRSQGDPVLYLSNPSGISRAQQDADVNAIGELNRQQAELSQRPGDRHPHRAV